MMTILVINAGSSSLKFQLFTGRELTGIATGLIERIGAAQSFARLDYRDTRSKQLQRECFVADHAQAVALMISMLGQSGLVKDLGQLAAIGHRVVHGGEMFHKPVRIDRQVITGIEKLIPLAPLHNPANLAGIRLLTDQGPSVPQVAVFDTAFHQSIPEHSYLYGLPMKMYDHHKVRRYGFHGTSHAYVARKAAAFLEKDSAQCNLITLHLGNGASVAAIESGRCVDTSMGMTPLEGLIMGTRCGDIDPAIIFYLAEQTGMSNHDIDSMLNRESGLRGICGQNDMRTIISLAKEGDARAKLGLEMFCYRIKKYIGSYMAVLGRTDALVFTGGIGENSAMVRAKSCQGLASLGIDIDLKKNSRHPDIICEVQTRQSRVAVLVIPTDEEREIALQTFRVVAEA